MTELDSVRQCVYCGESKSLEEFASEGHHHYGVYRRHTCKHCYQMRWPHTAPAAARALAEEWPRWMLRRGISA